ncbi:uncharacterized protein LTR77_010149 [Saxophila tyrrhenica]|uniref:Uncharacterized protein n=1 Tax=Saxophila tyrrhenica TaxID=1690608 RepID=A0AAV9NZV3_9PEZI|nr:hypothetical protein LTR77_010149 [Saxophila tyrrhenica]
MREYLPEDVVAEVKKVDAAKRSPSKRSMCCYHEHKAGADRCDDPARKCNRFTSSNLHILGGTKRTRPSQAAAWGKL